MSVTDIAPINGNCTHVWPCLVTILPCQMSTVRRTVRNVRKTICVDFTALSATSSSLCCEPSLL
jgi:hypothetical protein